jgi:cob(I)alamin adenosyltransferase
MTMNYQAESNAVEIKRLRDCYAELSKLHQADRRLDEQRIDTLRARVAELEAALESVCVALLPHDSRCQNVNAVFEAHDRARAALGAKGEGT